jgi:hypothetical protein
MRADPVEDLISDLNVARYLLLGGDSRYNAGIKHFGGIIQPILYHLRAGDELVKCVISCTTSTAGPNTDSAEYLSLLLLS